MDIDAERKAFEAWVSAGGRAHLLGRAKPHRWYKDLTVTAWWTAWQARAEYGQDTCSKKEGAEPTIGVR